MHVHPATWPRTPQGALLGLGVREELLLFSFSWGEAEAGRGKAFYIRSWDVVGCAAISTLAVQRRSQEGC